MDNPLVMQILLAVLILTALVVGGFSAKTWRAWDVVAGFLVFFSAAALLVLLSLSLKARRHWLKELDRYQKQYTAAVAEQTRLLYGDLTDVEQKDDSLKSLSAKLNRLLLDRGRVWREAVPAAPDAGGLITVTIAAAAAGSPHKIPQNFVLYVFREAASPTGVKIPITYVGEFQVAAVSETSVQLRAATLAPDLLRLSSQPNFQEAFTNSFVANTTWSLYEMLPVDDHRVFADPDLQPNLKVVGEPVFGAANEQQVRETLQFAAQNAAQAPRPELLEAMVARYLRDGRRAEPTDAPRDVQLKVEFVKDYTLQVDAEVPQAAMGPDFFDANGQAQVPFLRSGSENGAVTMRPGAVVVLPQEQATELINAGTCKLVEPIYVRPLRDYSFGLRSLYDRWVDTVNRVRLLQYNQKQLTDANGRINAVYLRRQDERSKLEADLAKVGYERTEITKLTQRLQQDLGQFEAAVNRLIRDNLALQQRLADAHRLITEQVERAVQEAVAVP